jgi:hypothetical protein
VEIGGGEQVQLKLWIAYIVEHQAQDDLADLGRDLIEWTAALPAEHARRNLSIEDKLDAEEFVEIEDQAEVPRPPNERDPIVGYPHGHALSPKRREGGYLSFSLQPPVQGPKRAMPRLEPPSCPRRERRHAGGEDAEEQQDPDGLMHAGTLQGFFAASRTADILHQKSQHGGETRGRCLI